MKKMTFSELCSVMHRFNKENMVRSKGVGAVLKAVIVFTEDSFEEEYSLIQRSYRVTNHNKAWIANQSSNSIFGYCLDGVDMGVRLDWYMGGKDGWKVDYCYLEEE